MSSGSHFFTFQFNDEQAYGLEMAQEKMRPIALGGMILEEGLKVLSISQEGQAVFQVAWHDYVVGDVIYFDSIEGMTEVNDRFITVIEVIDDHNFRTDFDSSQAAAFITDTDDSIARAGPPTPPPVPPPTPTPTPTPTPPVVTTGGGRGDDFHNRFDT